MKKYGTKDFERDFPNDDACLEWLKNNRWPNGIYCDKCGKITRHYRIKSRPVYSCEFCGNHVNPMAGTIFERTKFDHLRLWFKAVAYMAVTRCGISSRQLSRDLGVTVKTGYRMFREIRTILSDNDCKPLNGEVEVDETYIGAKKHWRATAIVTGNEELRITAVHETQQAFDVMKVEMRQLTLSKAIEIHGKNPSMKVALEEFAQSCGIEASNANAN